MSAIVKSLADPFGLADRPQTVLGVDPGAHGALALITLGNGFRFVDAADMPIRDRGKTTTINCLDARALRALVQRWRPTIAVIEDAQPMPSKGNAEDACPTCHRGKSTMPSKQAFTFGGMCESVRAVLEALDVDTVLVAPQTWKRAAGLKRGEKSRSEVKAASLALAREIWPDAPLKLARNENRAEALLIARFGLTSQMRFF